VLTNKAGGVRHLGRGATRVGRGMTRRTLLQGAAAFSLLSGVGRGTAQPMPNAAPTRPPALSRVRPGDPGWPDQTNWDRLQRQVGGRLVKVQSPLAPCRDAPDGAACLDVFNELKNPYYIGDDAALTQTCGWVDAWTAEPSVYAVAAEKTADVVAAVNLAAHSSVISLEELVDALLQFLIRLRRN